MEITKREKAIIKLLALKVEMEKAMANNFISNQQYSNFIVNLSDEEKNIIEQFNLERESTDFIDFSMQTLIKETP